MASIQSSAELQEIALSTIMKDTYLFTKVKNLITVNFFNKLSYKLIYKSLIFYYDKYGKLPNIQSLFITLSELHTDEYGDIESIKTDALNLINISRVDDEFVIDQLNKFIKRNRVESTLQNLLPKIQSGDSVSIDQIGEELISNLDVDIRKTKSMKLSDSSQLAEMRKEAVGSVDSPVMIKSSFEPINRSLQFKAYKPGDIILICAAPGCGKTMCCINEGTYAAMQGFNVLHLFIGDMLKYDGFIRYTSKITQIPQDDLVNLSITEQEELVKKYNYQGIFDRIVVDSVPASSMTIEEGIEAVFRIQDEAKMHFDMIIVDYPDNFIPPKDQMYESGGELFNKLSYLARRNLSVVIAATQPKQSYWDYEIIPKNGAAESSKKQHVIDLMVTLGQPFKGSPVLTAFLAKVRRGQEGTIFRIKKEFERASMHTINEIEYNKLKIESGGLTE